jgi:transcriptional accessory protein Tex/SPT6
VCRCVNSHRDECGPFPSRQELMRIKGLGPKTFEQCAGFLRVAGTNPLDATTVHPEAYRLAVTLCRRITGHDKISGASSSKGKGKKAGAGKDPGSLSIEQGLLDAARTEMRGLLSPGPANEAALRKHAEALGVTEIELRDVAEALVAPARDVRGRLGLRDLWTKTCEEEVTTTTAVGPVQLAVMWSNFFLL